MGQSGCLNLSVWSASPDARRSRLTSAVRSPGSRGGLALGMLATAFSPGASPPRASVAAKFLADVGSRLLPVAQLDATDLAGDGLGQVHELEAADALVRGEALLAE